MIKNVTPNSKVVNVTSKPGVEKGTNLKKNGTWEFPTMVLTVFSQDSARNCEHWYSCWELPTGGSQLYRNHDLSHYTIITIPIWTTSVFLMECQIGIFNVDFCFETCLGWLETLEWHVEVAFSWHPSLFAWRVLILLHKGSNGCPEVSYLQWMWCVFFVFVFVWDHVGWVWM